jgi:hypothetical protein
MQSTTLPNMYSDLSALSVEGKPLIVRNTFVDVMETPSEPLRKCKSLPTLPMESEHTCSEELLCDARYRVFRSQGKEDIGVDDSKTRSRSPRRREEASTRSPSMSIGSGSAQPSEGQTTFMIRGLPHSLTRRQLEELLDAEGFAARYNFIYLPADLDVGTCFGYGFVNLVNPEDAPKFVERFQGFNKWTKASPERAAVHTSEALQGIDALIERYRNSPLMHRSVPQRLRPAIYSNGARVNFPRPTTCLRPPRTRGAQKRTPPELERHGKV